MMHIAAHHHWRDLEPSFGPAAMERLDCFTRAFVPNHYSKAIIYHFWFFFSLAKDII